MATQRVDIRRRVDLSNQAAHCTGAPHGRIRQPDGKNARCKIGVHVRSAIAKFLKIGWNVDTKSPTATFDERQNRLWNGSTNLVLFVLDQERQTKRFSALASLGLVAHSECQDAIKLSAELGSPRRAEFDKERELFVARQGVPGQRGGTGRGCWRSHLLHLGQLDLPGDELPVALL